ncbi:YqhG family protein [Paenibacillus sp. R14(2021)]|uniref:YqhG family protein n=1 Tax=Paenibacillus sp. R14(2021) TaxID=2859228 RepID=UPI001C614B1C|nr:YqhG family protein [Paenibacillus sp. R14(2021)]
MNERQIHKFVQRYLDATDCLIAEKSPAHFQVKLSPRADRDLTNRPYYWSFVDRTGAEPETMSMLLVTDKTKYDESIAAAAKADAAAPSVPGSKNAAAEAALGRSFGHIHGTLNTNVRVPREDLYFGSRRLEQLFHSARSGGSYLCLFQEPEKRTNHPLHSTAYSAWLGVNMKVEFQCDMKREELHSFGISLATGQCLEQFHDKLLTHRMTPKLPPNVHTAKNALTLNKAASIVEQALERKLRTYDYSWADAAARRLEEELATIRHYYEPLIESSDGEKRPLIEEQFQRRQEEIRWQYEPRVSTSAINCGIFYLQGIG